MASDSIVPPTAAAPLLPQAILDASATASSAAQPSPLPVVDSTSLSSRGQRACQPIAPYWRRFLAAMSDQWSADNPSGHVLLCVAENKLNWQHWADKAAECRQLQPEVGAYADMAGRLSLRQQLARLMNRRMSSKGEPVAIEAEQLVIGNGVGPTLAMLVALLCEPGDGILIPSPLYAAFPNDLSLLAGAIPVPVRTERAQYRLTVDAFEAARAKFDGLASQAHTAQPQSNGQHSNNTHQAANEQQSTSITLAEEDHNSIRLYQQHLERTHTTPNRIKAVLLTNPHNPLGLIYQRAELEAVMAWAAQHGLHVIVDEIYANSIYDPMPPTQYLSSFVPSSSSPFYSALHYLSTPGPATAPLPLSHLHVLHGLSKDFGLSGYRLGWLATGSEAVRSAWGNVGYFTSVSNDVQCLVEHVLSDEGWTDKYLHTCCRLLARNYTTLARLLDGTHESLAVQQSSGDDSSTFTVPHVTPHAGMFAFIDLRRFLPAATAAADRTAAGNEWAREERLFDALFDEARVVLTPGHSQLADEPGWFRLCFGWIGEDALVAGMQRMRRVLYKRRRGDRGESVCKQDLARQNGSATAS